MDKRLHQKSIKNKIPFPGRSFFFGLYKNSTESRMKGLESYMNGLVEVINLLKYPEVWEFLQIDPSVRILLSSLDYEFQSDPYGLFENPDYFSKLKPIPRKENIKSSAEFLINEFLYHLNIKPLMITKTAKEFETMYFTRRPECDKDEIEQLLWGNGKLRGLLAYCGNLENFIGGIYCLNFLTKLLKYEYNCLAADNFLAAYRRTEPSLIRQMNLGKHIKMVMSCDDSGLLSLYYYLSGNVYGIYGAGEIVDDKRSIEVYENWVYNKIKCGYLSNIFLKKPMTRGNRIESKSTIAEDDKDSTYEIPNKSLKEIGITPDQIELSKAMASGKLEHLMNQLNSYSEWTPLDTEITKAGVLKAYVQGKHNFRLSIQFFSQRVDKLIEQFIDPYAHTIWSSIQRCVLYKADMIEIIRSRYTSQETIETILERQLEHFCDIGGDCIVIQEFSLLLPPLASSEIKRLNISAAVTQLSCKSDRYGANYVEYQAIWSVNEGYNQLPEYILYKNKELEQDLDKLINI